MRGLYACGWLRRGASGIIATNVADAEEVAAAVFEDYSSGAIGRPGGETGCPPGDPVSRLLRAHGVEDLPYEAFRRIDRHEREAGMKLTSIREMLAVATAAR